MANSDKSKKTGEGGEDSKQEDEVFEAPATAGDKPDQHPSGQEEDKDQEASKSETGGTVVEKSGAESCSLTIYDDRVTLQKLRCQVSTFLAGYRHSISFTEGNIFLKMFRIDFRLVLWLSLIFEGCQFEPSKQGEQNHTGTIEGS